ncbi:MAG TPA: polysaccharide biosynthesis tyrosine autokinase, partial [Abditibacteriaceae bacterium]|nr:polysaccharide biosynthesis tyrosine autokinase [Abditibacteriaceae bacterium]
ARMVAKAEIPTRPDSPRKALDLAMAIIIGCALAVGVAALAERLDDHVHSEDDARAVTRRPVLAHVPLIKEAGQHLLLNQSGKPSALLESYRMLRANIAFSALDEPITSLAITSSQPDEGKSTTAANLAMVMALDGKKVIIVDCDLRRPSLHRVFEIANKVGFTSVLAGSSSLAEALQETKVPGLYVLTSGPIPPNPTEMLNSKAGRQCFTQIMEQADFTVLDSPPALAMADAQIVASVADAVLLVISCTDTGKRHIARTSELLSQTGAKFLGTVLSKMPANDYRRYQYYGEYLSHENGEDHAPSESKDLEKV